MSSTSVTSRGDHSRSAIAAVRGQMRESTISGVVNSDHMVASPPRMRARSASGSWSTPLPHGSVA